MLTQTKISIEGLLDGYDATLTQMGYILTTKLLLVKRAELLIRRHANHGLDYISPLVITSYANEIEERSFNEKLQKIHYWRKKREIHRFVEYVDSGKSDMLPSPLRASRQKLLPEFERVENKFISGNFIQIHVAIWAGLFGEICSRLNL